MAGRLLLAAVLLPFWFGGQSNLDQAANCLGPAWLVRLVRGPLDQLVVPIQDKAAIQRAFLYRFWDARGRAFFCYQLLTASIFSVIGKSRAEQERLLLPSSNPSHGGTPWPRLIPFVAQFRRLSQARSRARPQSADSTDRRYFIGGSDARIIMGDDEAGLVRLWREKRGEIEPEDLSGNLIVQLGVATEDLNRRWYEANSGQVLTDIQTPDSASGAALDGGHARWPG